MGKNESCYAQVKPWKICHRMKTRTPYVQWTILPLIFVEPNHHPKTSEFLWNSDIIHDSEDLPYNFSVEVFCEWEEIV
jgi:hypothetical protein